MSEGFKWNEDDVCIQPTIKTAVYCAYDNQIAIRQEGNSLLEDQIIIIHPENVEDLINKLIEVKKDIEASFEE